MKTNSFCWLVFQSFCVLSTKPLLTVLYFYHYDKYSLTVEFSLRIIFQWKSYFSLIGQLFLGSLSYSSSSVQIMPPTIVWSVPHVAISSDRKLKESMSLIAILFTIESTKMWKMCHFILSLVASFCALFLITEFPLLVAEASINYCQTGSSWCQTGLHWRCLKEWGMEREREGIGASRRGPLLLLYIPSHSFPFWGIPCRLFKRTVWVLKRI